MAIIKSIKTLRIGHLYRPHLTAAENPYVRINPDPAFARSPRFRPRSHHRLHLVCLTRITKPSSALRASGISNSRPNCSPIANARAPACQSFLALPGCPRPVGLRSQAPLITHRAGLLRASTRQSRLFPFVALRPPGAFRAPFGQYHMTRTGLLSSEGCKAVAYPLGQP